MTGAVEIRSPGVAPEPVVADLRTATRQHVVKKPLEKFDAGECDVTGRLRPIVAIAKRHVVIVNVCQAAVGDRDAKQIPREVVEDVLPVTRKLGVHHPWRGPHRGRDGAEQVRASEGGAHLGAHDHRQRADWDEERRVLRSNPLRLIGGQPAGGDHKMDVRMIEQRARPGVQHGDAANGGACQPTDWSPDGQWLVLNAGSDVWKVQIKGGSATPLLNGPFVEHDARISPDGRWIAYVSHESGRPEVYMRTLSAPSRRLVASSGGNQPVWRRDGRALFYVSLNNQLHVVPVQRDEDGSLSLGTRVKLPIERFGASHIGTTYDMSPDAGRVYFPHAGDPAKAREIGLVLNWSALLR